MVMSNMMMAVVASMMLRAVLCRVTAVEHQVVEVARRTDTRHLLALVRG